MDEVLDKKENKDTKTQKQLTEALEFAKWRDAFQRKNFDYQERWHGWQSPIGLGSGFFTACLGLYFLSLAWTNLR